ncbi:hypothetical protein DH2020_044870 [Rehmannia glutinosa]|uniref:Reverse transcriptase domain-containing protein n=1 Tax=Rehmannia glutinosa TaxID=99300 RepID=A0ABR0UFQ1_REHGL
METKLHSTKAIKLRDRLGFQNGVAVSSVGRSGGLALFWKADIDVTIKALGRFFVDAIINQDVFPWRFTGFYGNPTRSERIQDDSGVWITDEKLIAEEIEKYFNSIFSTSSPLPQDMEQIISAVRTRIPADFAEDLERPFTSDEVKKAIFSMGPLKAPGPDGFQPIFFQKNWDIVGPDLVDMALNILNNGQSIGDFNNTHVVLIPKSSQPRCVADYTLISLCNVTYKVVTKVIANRLKVVLPEIISEEQSAFVPGRLISDNIMIAYETMQTIKSRTRGQNGLMARLSFRINGTISGSVVPTRGLRQGCPLSPYLFLICIEGLSAWIRSHENSQSIHGISFARGAPKISHLLFADDSIIFSKASQGDAISIHHMLTEFARASGQQINFSKTYITFSPNVGDDTREAICNTLGISTATQTHDCYLGLPAMVGKNRKRTFQNIKERVQKRLKSWKANMFSSGGREILIKSVAQASATFSMSIFMLPRSLCTELQGLVAKFWWGGNDTQRKIHWMRWDLLSRAKIAGGMGFRDLELFNQSLLAKQAWRLIKHNESLVSRVLRAKYHPNDPFIQAQLGRCPSYIWRSVLWGRELLKQGIRWRIGNGRSTHAFNEPWLPRPLTFKPITPPPNDTNTCVADLISNHSWDISAINNIFWPCDREEILKIPLGRENSEDTLIWHYEKSGIYSVRSGYRVAIAHRAPRARQI